MRVLLQRVRSASVSVGGEIVARIGPGLVVFVGIAHDDTAETCRRLADKAVDLRIFEDAEGRMNRSIREMVDGGGQYGVLIVSQFTLYADARKGRRPSFAGAAPPDLARPLVELFAEHILAAGMPVEQGRFGAEMLVALENNGPVTIWLDSHELMR